MINHMPKNQELSFLPELCNGFFLFCGMADLTSKIRRCCIAFFYFLYANFRSYAGGTDLGRTDHGQYYYRPVAHRIRHSAGKLQAEKTNTFISSWKECLNRMV